MRKNIFFIGFVFLTCSFADSFTQNCKSCHGKNQLQMFMSKYTLEHSSKSKIIKAMAQYMQNPQYENSLMPRGFLNRFGLKPKTTLKPEELESILNEYYLNYNLPSKFY